MPGDLVPAPQAGPPDLPVRSRLAGRLGLPPAGLAELGSLARLNDAALERLDAVLAAAQADEDREVRRALRAAVRLVPPLLRRRAGAALFPHGPDRG
ncbi:hypothetical protein RDV89_05435 [Nocardioides zeae]|uniref:Uncharacterized protein n=1 Tax=Nocardioides imazamoxiresistens TaxID=3231893 RepID=A0ABU3PTI1_9ACTN|nr:hypothetical protein [Nocardioides zeae]MDT9592499.1 hypothetical protein [Nocardioides zeae]